MWKRLPLRPHVVQALPKNTLEQVWTGWGQVWDFSSDGLLRLSSLNTCGSEFVSHVPPSRELSCPPPPPL